MRLERQARDHAERAAAAAAQREEQLRLLPAIDGADPAVGGDHLGLEQARRAGSELLGQAAEAAALDEAGGADSQAAAALDVAAMLDRYLAVDLAPQSAGAERHGRHALDVARRAGCAEGIVHLDAAQPMGPDQQRARAVGIAEIAMAAALDDQRNARPAGKVDGRGNIAQRIRAATALRLGRLVQASIQPSDWVSAGSSAR